jgi:hypothetical protein
VNNLKYSEDDSTPEDETKNILSSVRNLPERYKISEHDNKRFLMCLEAPNIRVQIEPGLTVSSSAARKKQISTDPETYSPVIGFP